MNYVGKSPGPDIAALLALEARVTALEGRQTIIPLAAAGGAQINFLGIPAGIKKLWAHFLGVSTNGVSIIIAQLGSAGGIEIAGYHGNAAGVNTGAVIGSGADFTTGLPLHSLGNAGSFYHGFMSLVHAGGNTWLAHGCINSDSGNTPTFFFAGSKTLAGPLDRFRLTTVGGVEIFDGGQVGIAYE